MQSQDLTALTGTEEAIAASRARIMREHRAAQGSAVGDDVSFVASAGATADTTADPEADAFDLLDQATRGDASAAVAKALARDADARLVGLEIPSLTVVGGTVENAFQDARLVPLYEWAMLHAPEDALADPRRWEGEIGDRRRPTLAAELNAYAAAHGATEGLTRAARVRVFIPVEDMPTDYDRFQMPEPLTWAEAEACVEAGLLVPSRLAAYDDVEYIHTEGPRIDAVYARLAGALMSAGLIAAPGSVATQVTDRHGHTTEGVLQVTCNAFAEGPFRALMTDGAVGQENLPYASLLTTTLAWNPGEGADSRVVRGVVVSAPSDTAPEDGPHPLSLVTEALGWGPYVGDGWTPLFTRDVNMPRNRTSHQFRAGTVHLVPTETGLEAQPTTAMKGVVVPFAMSEAIEARRTIAARILTIDEEGVVALDRGDGDTYLMETLGEYRACQTALALLDDILYAGSDAVVYVRGDQIKVGRDDAKTGPVVHCGTVTRAQKIRFNGNGQFWETLDVASAQPRARVVERRIQVEVIDKLATPWGMASLVDEEIAQARLAVFEGAETRQVVRDNLDDLRAGLLSSAVTLSSNGMKRLAAGEDLLPEDVRILPALARRLEGVVASRVRRILNGEVEMHGRLAVEVVDDHALVAALYDRPATRGFHRGQVHSSKDGGDPMVEDGPAGLCGEVCPVPLTVAKPLALDGDGDWTFGIGADVEVPVEGTDQTVPLKVVVQGRYPQAGRPQVYALPAGTKTPFDPTDDHEAWVYGTTVSETIRVRVNPETLAAFEAGTHTGVLPLESAFRDVVSLVNTDGAAKVKGARVHGPLTEAAAVEMVRRKAGFTTVGSRTRNKEVLLLMSAVLRYDASREDSTNVAALLIDCAERLEYRAGQVAVNIETELTMIKYEGELPAVLPLVVYDTHGNVHPMLEATTNMGLREIYMDKGRSVHDICSGIRTLTVPERLQRAHDAGRVPQTEDLFSGSVALLARLAAVRRAAGDPSFVGCRGATAAVFRRGLARADEAATFMAGYDRDLSHAAKVAHEHTPTRLSPEEKTAVRSLERVASTWGPYWQRILGVNDEPGYVDAALETAVAGTEDLVRERAEREVSVLIDGLVRALRAVAAKAPIAALRTVGAGILTRATNARSQHLRVSASGRVLRPSEEAQGSDALFLALCGGRFPEVLPLTGYQPFPSPAPDCQVIAYQRGRDIPCKRGGLVTHGDQSVWGGPTIAVAIGTDRLVVLPEMYVEQTDDGPRVTGTAAEVRENALVLTVAVPSEIPDTFPESGRGVKVRRLARREVLVSWTPPASRSAQAVRIAEALVPVADTEAADDPSAPVRVPTPKTALADALTAAGVV